MAVVVVVPDLPDGDLGGLLGVLVGDGEAIDRIAGDGDLIDAASQSDLVVGHILLGDGVGHSLAFLLLRQAGPADLGLILSGIIGDGLLGVLDSDSLVITISAGQHQGHHIALAVLVVVIVPDLPGLDFDGPGLVRVSHLDGTAVILPGSQRLRCIGGGISVNCGFIHAVGDGCAFLLHRQVLPFILPAVGCIQRLLCACDLEGPGSAVLGVAADEGDGDRSRADAVLVLVVFPVLLHRSLGGLRRVAVLELREPCRGLVGADIAVCAVDPDGRGLQRIAFRYAGLSPVVLDLFSRTVGLLLIPFDTQRHRCPVVDLVQFHAARCRCAGHAGLHGCFFRLAFTVDLIQLHSDLGRTLAVLVVHVVPGLGDRQAQPLRVIGVGDAGGGLAIRFSRVQAAHAVIDRGQPGRIFNPAVTDLIEVLVLRQVPDRYRPLICVARRVHCDGCILVFAGIAGDGARRHDNLDARLRVVGHQPDSDGCRPLTGLVVLIHPLLDHCGLSRLVGVGEGDLRTGLVRCRRDRAGFVVGQSHSDGLSVRGVGQAAVGAPDLADVVSDGGILRAAVGVLIHIGQRVGDLVEGHSSGGTAGGLNGPGAHQFSVGFAQLEGKLVARLELAARDLLLSCQFNLACRIVVIVKLRHGQRVAVVILDRQCAVAVIRDGHDHFLFGRVIRNAILDLPVIIITHGFRVIRNGFPDGIGLDRFLVRTGVLVFIQVFQLVSDGAEGNRLALLDGGGCFDQASAFVELEAEGPVAQFRVVSLSGFQHSLAGGVVSIGDCFGDLLILVNRCQINGLCRRHFAALVYVARRHAGIIFIQRVPGPEGQSADTEAFVIPEREGDGAGREVIRAGDSVGGIARLEAAGQLMAGGCGQGQREGKGLVAGCGALDGLLDLDRAGVNIVGECGRRDSCGIAGCDRYGRLLVGCRCVSGHRGIIDHRQCRAVGRGSFGDGVDIRLQVRHSYKSIAADSRRLAVDGRAADRAVYNGDGHRLADLRIQRGAGYGEAVRTIRQGLVGSVHCRVVYRHSLGQLQTAGLFGVSVGNSGGSRIVPGDGDFRLIIGHCQHVTCNGCVGFVLNHGVGSNGQVVPGDRFGIPDLIILVFGRCRITGGRAGRDPDRDLLIPGRISGIRNNQIAFTVLQTNPELPA